LIGCSIGGFSCLLMAGAIWSFVELCLAGDDDKSVVVVEVSKLLEETSLAPLPNKPEKLED
jgi:hypothetical protein